MNWLKNKLADLLGLLTANDALALDPDLENHAGQAAAKSVTLTTNANTKEAQAAGLLKSAATDRKQSARIDTALDRYHKASGG